MFYTTKICRKFDKDGKIVEETIETNKSPGEMNDVDEVSKELDKTFGKMNSFFKKMEEAFKELW